MGKVGTPFVSRPTLDNNNGNNLESINLSQNLHEVSKDEGDELSRIKLELERKDRELREAKKMIEEIKRQ